MQPGPADRIRVVLAALNDRQRSLIESQLEQANVVNRLVGANEFNLDAASGRGLAVLAKAAMADVVLFGLEDEELPGEASHVLAAYPNVKVVGIDDEGHARIVLGALLEPLNRDLPTVIRWITGRKVGTSDADVSARTARDGRAP